MARLARIVLAGVPYQSEAAVVLSPTALNGYLQRRSREKVTVIRTTEMRTVDSFAIWMGGHDAAR
jgi:hypothetical protein